MHVDQGAEQLRSRDRQLARAREVSQRGDVGSGSGGAPRVDRAQGTVRLTVDRAMDLLAKEAAENRLTYSSKPYAVKTPEQLAAGGAAAPAAPGPGGAAKPQGATTTNATPPPAK